MSPMATTPQPDQFVLEFGGYRYLPASPEQAGQVISGARAWDVTLVEDQNVPSGPFTVPLGDFSGGWAHMWYDQENGYDLADGFDTSVPGIGAVTWHRDSVATAQTATSAMQFFFVMKHPTDATITYLYHCAGRYVYKYPIAGTSPVVGTLIESHDLGAANIIAGPPAVFNGRAYVPRMTVATINTWSPSLTTWEELTTVAAGVGDTWTTGAANRQARGFTVWDGPLGSLLVLFNGNNIRTASAISSPPVDGDWSGTSAAGDGTYGITTLATYKPNLLVVGLQDGWGTFDEQLTFHYEKKLPPELYNCLGMAEHDGWVYIPSTMGRYRWRPGAYERIGAEWIRDKDMNTTSVFRSSGFVSIGETLFEVVAMLDAAVSTLELAVIGYYFEGGKVVPHMHHRISGAAAASSNPESGITVAKSQGGTWTAIVVACPTTAGNAQLSSFYFIYDGARPAAQSGNGAADTLAKSLRTSFYPLGSLAVQKTVRGIRFHLEVASAADIANMSVWYRFIPSLMFPAVAESWTQMLDSAGAAASFDDPGVVELWLPQTSAAVGRAIQFEFRVASGGTSAWYRIRDAEMFGTVDPELAEEIRAIVVAVEGQFEDGTWQQVDPRTQLTRLKALAEPNTAPVSYRDPTTGGTGRLKVQRAEFREIKFNDLGPRWVAILNLRQMEYS